MLTEKGERWNRFIDEICGRELDELSGIQKAAALCLRYDAEVQGDGHYGFFDCYPDIKPEELIAAINLIGYKEIAENYRKALEEQARDGGEADGYETVDSAYYEFEPSLCDLLMEFVENNKEEIFRG